MPLPVMNASYLPQLQAFERQILSNQTKIEAWFRSKWKEHKPPFYGSVDIRNAGYKMASIDMNLFPGGFNNLNPNFIQLASHAALDAVERACPQAKSVLIVPENHTRNTFYLQNVYALSNILRNAGFEVRLGSINPEITEPVELETALGDTVTLEPLQRTRGRVHLADGFSPCLILLNNDLSAGVPDILKDISQTVLPPLHGGWTTRRKTAHFSAYNDVAAEFAALVGMDEWQINPYFEQISGLNFQEREGEDALADAVERMLAKIQAKYDEKGITDQPFVIVKADAGTYGMGVMSVKSADEVRGLNRKNPQQNGKNQRRPGSERSHRAGRHLHLRNPARRGIRACGLYDGPLRRRRILPRARRARRGRKPERHRHVVRAAQPCHPRGRKRPKRRMRPPRIRAMAGIGRAANQVSRS